MSTRLASCSCGQLEVTVRCEPVRISMCHCLACQRRTGSVFGAQARFPASQVEIAGVSQSWTRKADSGNLITFHFCPGCGSTVYYLPEKEPEVVAVPIGAFADPGFPPPKVSVYEARRHPWVAVPDGAEHHD
jgi:hypothetical protein